jgi:DNA polymerase III subunit chi
MHEVEFHTGVQDALHFACRLLRKAVRQGVRVQVTAPDEVLSGLDRLLWTFEERDFVPHVRVASASPAVTARTPIWLTSAALGADAPRILVNLDAEPPSNLVDLDRIIEIVSSDADEAARGRMRWRHYKGLGLAIRHHPEPGTSSA